jgi:hypothetical protein
VASLEGLRYRNVILIPHKHIAKAF